MLQNPHPPNGGVQPTGHELIEATPFTQVTPQAVLVYDEIASDQLDRDYWRLMCSIRFYVGKPDDQTWVWVPSGFLTDGATVPRLLYWLVPPWGRYGHAAVIHDWLCEHLKLYQRGQMIDIDRKQADQIFNEAMKATGVNGLTRRLMYGGVTAWRWFSKLIRRRPDNTPTGYLVLKWALEKDWRDVHPQ